MSRNLIMEVSGHETFLWLSDELWEPIKPHLPYRAAGKRREDDRRVISGITHGLRAACCWRDCPPEYGPSTAVYNSYNSWSQNGIWQYMFAELTAALSGTPEQISLDTWHVKARGWRKRGTSARATGRSEGGRYTKVHATSEEHCRPLAFYLTPGKTADLKGVVMPSACLPDA